MTTNREKQSQINIDKLYKENNKLSEQLLEKITLNEKL